MTYQNEERKLQLLGIKILHVSAGHGCDIAPGSKQVRVRLKDLLVGLGSGFRIEGLGRCFQFCSQTGRCGCRLSFLADTRTRLIFYLE